MNAVSAVKTDEATKIEFDMKTSEQSQPEVATPPARELPIRPVVVASQAAQPAAALAPRKRASRRLLLMIVLPLALAVGGSYAWLAGGRYEETENANLRQPRVVIASELPGRITDVEIAENMTVKTGDTLFVVDAEPYRIALEQADAALANARVSVEQLRATYSEAIARENTAKNEVGYQTAQFQRQQELSAKGINTRSAFDEAQRNMTKAQDDQAAAREVIGSARAALDGNPDIATNDHPTVRAAQAARDKAAYDLGQTTVRAPADGIVAQASSFKVGQYVGAGTALFSLVETNDTWVDANFKETQLTNIKPGQQADIVIDTYPGMTFKATVEAIGAGTGAEFSLLPAQNATGNWVKVTQRIPVRMKIDAADAKVALRMGMSASVSVDTGVSRSLSDIAFVGGFFGAAHAAQ